MILGFNENLVKKIIEYRNGADRKLQAQRTMVFFKEEGSIAGIVLKLNL